MHREIGFYGEFTTSSDGNGEGFTRKPSSIILTHFVKAVFIGMVSEAFRHNLGSQVNCDSFVGLFRSAHANMD